MYAVDLREAPAGLVCTGDGSRVSLRPVRPSDAALVQQFVRGLSPASRRRRFFSAVSELSPEQLDRMTHLEPPDGLALAATCAGASPRIVGIAQYALSGPADAEVAVAVTDDWQRRGLGESLLVALLDHAARSGITTAHGLVLAENWPMVMLAAKLGFSVSEHADERLLSIEKPLVSRHAATCRPAAVAA